MNKGILEGPIRMCGHRFGGARLCYFTPIADKLHLCPYKVVDKPKVGFFF